MRSENINTSLNKSNNELKFSFIDLVNKKVDFIAEENQSYKILITNLVDDCCINISLKKNSSVTLSVLGDKKCKNLSLKGLLHENSTLKVYFADFIQGQILGDINIDLLDEGASLKWHLASLSSKTDDKHFSVTVIHHKPLTYATVDNYGVARDSSKLVFSGVSYIANGAIKSNTKQNAKIMIFDKTSSACAKPILKIDENDVVASHAAIVGEINEEHLYYLTSRGICLDDAKKLITYGYLKPILKGFSSKEDQEKIVNLIEGNI